MPKCDAHSILRIVRSVRHVYIPLSRCKMSLPPVPGLWLLWGSSSVLLSGIWVSESQFVQTETFLLQLSRLVPAYKRNERVRLYSEGLCVDDLWLALPKWNGHLLKTDSEQQSKPCIDWKGQNAIICLQFFLKVIFSKCAQRRFFKRNPLCV